MVRIRPCGGTIADQPVLSHQRDAKQIASTARRDSGCKPCVRWADVEGHATSHPILPRPDTSRSSGHNPFMDPTSAIFRDILFWIAVAAATGVALATVVMRLRREPNAPRRQARVAALAIALVVSLLALAVYLKVGRPEAPNPASEARQPAADAINSRSEADSLVHRLRLHLEKQPRDARGWVVLARLHADKDRFEEAAQAYARALAASHKVAADPAVWCEYADALGMAQGGNLAGRPREMIDRALALDPNHPKALEMAGSAEYAQGDYVSALRFWRPLLASMTPGSQAYNELAAAIARSERLAATALPPQPR